VEVWLDDENWRPHGCKFNGKERDNESGLDNFGARYDASSLGRFTTPDWAAKPVTVPYAKFGDPQTLNLYSYVENEPVNRVDPDGHEDEAPAGGADSSDSSGGQTTQKPGNAGGTTNQTQPTPQPAASQSQSQTAQNTAAAAAVTASQTTMEQIDRLLSL